MKIRLQPWLAFLGFLSLAAPLSGQTVTAGFQPEIISVGGVAVYRVEFENMSLQTVPEVNPPRVAGLRVLGITPGTSRNTSIINGRVSSSFTLSWQVAATREGTFTVPAQEISINGERASVPEATLRVVPEREISLFRLEWELSEKDYYVGEAIPVLLKLYLRADIRTNPQNLSIELEDGLVASPEEDPEVAREQVEGVSYNVVYWSRILTPIRPGSFALNASIELVYEDPTGRRRSDFLFSRPATQRKLVLAPEVELAVEEIPGAGRPASFNGAVGNFTSEATLDATEVPAGEPLTLELQLAGSGNFDRIAAPEIPELPGWRIYPPKVSFTPADELGFQGTKTFEYLLIPGDEVIAETPPVPFSAFDPYGEAFIDLSIPPQPIKVLPAPAVGATVSFADEPEAAPRPRTPRRGEAAWRSFRAELGTLHAEGVRPIIRTPLFWSIQAAAGLAMALWLTWRWRRKRLSDDEAYARRVSASKTVRHWLREAGEAAARSDAERFFAAAQRTVQEAAGKYFPRSRKAESLTLSEIDQKLEERGIDGDRRAEVATLFQAGDALRYAGIATDAEALRQHQQKLEAILRALR